MSAEMERPHNKAMSADSKARRCISMRTWRPRLRKVTETCGFVFWSTISTCPVCGSNLTFVLDIPNDYGGL